MPCKRKKYVDTNDDGGYCHDYLDDFVKRFRHSNILHKPNDKIKTESYDNEVDY
jgi:hypothetical protein